MTATNHVMTGVLIVAVVSNPWIALPLALASHLVMDIVPHFGLDPERQIKVFIPYLIIDATLAGSILLALLITRPANYWMLIAGGVIAASPDLLSITFFINILRHKHHEFGLVQRFLQRIQWSESVYGLALEIPWFLLAGGLVLQRLR